MIQALTTTTKHMITMNTNSLNPPSSLLVQLILVIKSYVSTVALSESLHSFQKLGPIRMLLTVAMRCQAHSTCSPQILFPQYNPSRASLLAHFPMQFPSKNTPWKHDRLNIPSDLLEAPISFCIFLPPWLGSHAKVLYQSQSFSDSLEKRLHDCSEFSCIYR